MKSLQDLSVLITGGGSGIGAGTARYLAELGAKVTITGRREQKLLEVAAESTGGIRTVVGDITREEDRRAMVAAAVEHGGKLDLLFNNAGNISHTPLMTMPEHEMTSIMQSNVIAPLLLTREAVPHLEATAGSVVFVGSIHTRRAVPGRVIYAASKGAVQTMVRVLAAELAPRAIRVNCVIPGGVATEINIRSGLHDAEQAAEFYRALNAQHPLGRIGTATEIAEAVAYLACAEWTTGALLDVDGGLGLGASALR